MLSKPQKMLLKMHGNHQKHYFEDEREDGFMTFRTRECTHAHARTHVHTQTQAFGCKAAAII